MQSRAAAGLSLLLALGLGTLLARAQNEAAGTSATSPPEISLTPEAILAANTLQKDGRRPFHLKLSFRIFDLQGKAGEQGTLEYWWAAAEGSHLDITTPSLGTVHSTEASSVNHASARTLYLIGELFNNVRFPGAELGFRDTPLITEKRTVANIPLICMRSAPPPGQDTPAGTEVCADSATGTIRLITGKDRGITRNMVGRFGDTRVTLDDTLVWGGRKAATAHVDQLQSFDPVKTTIALERHDVPADAMPEEGNARRIPGGVLAGKKVSGPQPVYPPVALQERIRGTVVLSALITKEGKVANLFALASPDPLLTQAAMDAVRKWTYTPYLLHGEATDVSTTITVNFNMTSQP